jgi:hypothetical protein
MNFWKWLDGKKSKIALIYWTVVTPALPIIFDGGVPPNVEKAVTILGFLLSAIGLGHAGIKSLTK